MAGSRDAIVVLCFASAVSACLSTAAMASGAVPSNIPAHVSAAFSLSVSILALVWLSAEDIRFRLLPTKVVRPYALCAASFSLSLVVLEQGASTAALLAMTWRMALGFLPVCATCVVALAIDGLARSRRAAGCRSGGKGAGSGSCCGGGKPGPIGGGDIRLMCAISLQLGPDVLVSIACACILGIVFSLVSRQRSFPFGPCLALPATVTSAVQLLAVFQWI